MTDDFLRRASRLLNLEDYGASISRPERQDVSIQPPDASSQYVLRMMVRSPESRGLIIPESLRWLEKTIHECDSIQRFHSLANEYVYVTVRHGPVTSQTDDSWHVDGFSMRTPHVPEQSYILASEFPTEWQDRAFPIPASFDPLRHNIHDYLAKSAVRESARQCLPNQVYAIDPYCVHRRPPQAQAERRTFWRISFVPIEIQDDTCTPNPLLPPKRYNRRDFRTTLTAWAG